MTSLTEAEPVTLTIRRLGEMREVRLTAAAMPDTAGDRPLGLTLRAIRDVGAEIVRVAPGSAAFRAHLQVRDVITLIGDVDSPTPAQVSRAFAALPNDRSVVAAVTRGEQHFIVALGRWR
jgi:S1-C subfamily serine protease